MGMSSCGERAYWELDPNGTLTVSGDGKMNEFACSKFDEKFSEAPWDKGKITRVVIEEGIKRIGRGAFSNCRKINEIKIPSSVEEIGYGAFWWCGNLVSVVFTEGLSVIEPLAFYMCCSLKELNVPDSVESIGEGAFADCSLLENIEVDANNRVYDSRNDCNAVIETASNTLICGCGSTVIPDDIKHIGNSAFSSCKNLFEITVPEGVESIGDRAFSECRSLVQVKLPTSVRTIGGEAFSQCESLTEITIPDGVGSIGAFAFYGCRNLVRLNLPTNLRMIGEHAFARCESLTEITIPDGVESIGSSAFSECYNLVHLKLPISLRTIGSFLFSGCLNLTELRIPKGVKKIEMYAFSGCNRHIKIYIPSTLEEIGAFELEDLAKDAILVCETGWTADMLPKSNAALLYTGGKPHDLKPELRQRAAWGYLISKSYNNPDFMPWKNSYNAVIEKQSRVFLDRALSHRDIDIIYFLMENNLISEGKADEAIQKAIKMKETELAAALMDYKRRRFNKRKKKDPLNL